MDRILRNVLADDDNRGNVSESPSDIRGGFVGRTHNCEAVLDVLESTVSERIFDETYRVEWDEP